MKSALGVLLLLAVVLSLSACQGLNPDLIEPSAANITERHDAYVEKDASLSPPEKAAYLQESELLMRVIHEAQKDR